MNSTACPDQQQLARYLLGQLDQTSESALDEHWEACVACQKAADDLDGDMNARFTWLKQARTETTDQESRTLERLVRQAKSIAESKQPGTGDVLGNYLLLEPIGEGGMGRVFKARHQRLKRLVALKLVTPKLHLSEHARAQFQREMEAVARVSSPHIVAAYDAGESAGHDFLVMEYVPGQNLAEVVKTEGPLSVARALKYAMHAAIGLADAHAAGIVHRDVKPANLLLDDKGVVKVSDLGLASVPWTMDADTESSPAPPAMGTAAYMAPEQAENGSRPETSSDIYSLGCTLFFLLAGRPPFSGPSSLDVLKAHRQQAIPCLKDARANVPEGVDRLVQKMIAKDSPSAAAKHGRRLPGD